MWSKTLKNKIVPTTYSYFFDTVQYRKVVEEGQVGYHQIVDKIDICLTDKDNNLWSIKYGCREWDNKTNSFERHSTTYSLEESFKIVKEIVDLYNISRQEIDNLVQKI